MSRRVALIAGSGSLVPPVIAAIRRSGDTLSIISVTPRDDLGADAVPLGSLKMAELLDALRAFGPTHIALAGGIHISDDERSSLAYASGTEGTSPVGDMALAGIATRFETLTGARLIDLDTLVPELLAPPGPIAGPEPSAELQSVAVFAFEQARAAGALDLCQAVVASGHRLVAVEDIGGTDLLLDRVRAFRERGLVGTGVAPLVLAKVSKPGQPAFFDLPAIGPLTVAKAAAAGITMIVVEAGRTLLLDRAALESEAARHGVAVFGRRASD